MKHHEKLNDALHIIIREPHQFRLSLILSFIFEFSKIKTLKNVLRRIVFIQIHKY